MIATNMGGAVPAIDGHFPPAAGRAQDVTSSETAGDESAPCDPRDLSMTQPYPPSFANGSA
jgi:hypothetical protein